MIQGNAEILLVQDDGSVVLQVRDDKPGITNPGMISSFGGHIEDGEEPLDAAVREINEETNLGVTKDQLIFYDKRRKTREVHGEDWDVYYFAVQGVSTEGLEVYEGSGYTVIHTLDELRAVKTSNLLGEVLTDYFEGFRNYLFFPHIDSASRAKLYDEYLTEILESHQLSKFINPIVLACTGLVASGKSTITAPLADVADCVTVSSDQVRERFFRRGFNLEDIRSFVGDLINELSIRGYNIFLDFNIATNIGILDDLVTKGYRPYVLHANPPLAFIEDKILSGKMKHELTFFAKDEHVHRSLLTWKDDHLEKLEVLKAKYDIWEEVDTSRDDLDDVISKMAHRFQAELTMLDVR